MTMDDSNPSTFDRLLAAAEGGSPAPADLSADDTVDMALARRLFALRVDTAAPGGRPWQVHVAALVPPIRGEATANVAPADVASASVSPASASTKGDLTAVTSALPKAHASAMTTSMSVDPHPVLTLWDRRVTIALALAVAAGVFAVLWREGRPPGVRPTAQVTPAVATTQRETATSIRGSATAMPSARAVGGSPAAQPSDGASSVVRGIATSRSRTAGPMVPGSRPVVVDTDHPTPHSNAHSAGDDEATASPVATALETATTRPVGSATAIIAQPSATVGSMTATADAPTPMATASSVPGPPTVSATQPRVTMTPPPPPTMTKPSTPIGGAPTELYTAEPRTPPSTVDATMWAATSTRQPMPGGTPTAVATPTPSSPLAMLQSQRGANACPIFSVWHAPVAGR